MRVKDIGKFNDYIKNIIGVCAIISISIFVFSSPNTDKLLREDVLKFRDPGMSLKGEDEQKQLMMAKILLLFVC